MPMKLPFPDNELVKKAQKGNRHAFDLLVLKYQHQILKIIRRYVADHHDSFDITQESFMKAYLALPNFHGDSSFHTWLYQIAVKTAKNYLAQTLKHNATTTKKISASNLTENSLVGEETASCFAKSV